jgi:hypothetical protein
MKWLSLLGLVAILCVLAYYTEHGGSRLLDDSKTKGTESHLQIPFF